jgi:hypothetical protein
MDMSMAAPDAIIVQTGRLRASKSENQQAANKGYN